MAELKGPFLFTGSIGNIRAYYNKTLKRFILSTKGGSNKTMIENNPRFARQLENMNEFRACTLWASLLRRLLVDIGYLHQGYYFSAIVAMGKSIQKHDDVLLKGKRSIESSKAAHLLTSLNFNPSHLFDQVLTHQYAVLFSQDKRTVTLKLLGFKSFSRIVWPGGFDCYRIALVIGLLPDIIWSEKENRYLPVATGKQRLSFSSFSDWRPCSTVIEDVILSASFAQPALQQPGTTVVVAVGIEVSKANDGSSASGLTGYGTMRIVECFV